MPQFCPAFWDWLHMANNQQKVFSIDKVREELQKGSDPLAKWAECHNKEFFLPYKPEVELALVMLSEWVNSPPLAYKREAIDVFLQSADLFLIAYAITYGHVVVTHEQPSDTRKKVKIPNVCEAMNVEWTTTFKMLLNEKACFVLEDL